MKSHRVSKYTKFTSFWCKVLITVIHFINREFTLCFKNGHEY